MYIRITVKAAGYSKISFTMGKMVGTVYKYIGYLSLIVSKTIHALKISDHKESHF